ncbi:MAG: acyl-CoA thioesterase II [Polyangiales bacterium]
MTQALSNLLTQLDLQTLATDTFLGPGPGGTRRRVFGGHVAAQALSAAGRCSEGLAAHSLHLYFLRPGDPTAAVEFRVERLRDGRSYATRLVRAIQHDQVILHASLSFVSPEHDGFEHQITPPDVPPPAACPTWEAWAAPRIAQMSPETRAQYVRERPIEVRPISPVDPTSPAPAGTRQQFWMRAPSALGDDPLLHQTLATYISDHTLLSAVLRPHGRTFMSRGMLVASLDHAMWFHRPFRVDQWLLYSQETPTAFAGRGLALGHYFDERGTLVASMAQEGVLRQR